MGRCGKSLADCHATREGMMNINDTASIEDQGESMRGIKPHPEFETFSDERLELHQTLIDQSIAWAKEDHDDFAVSWYEIEMAMLQKERAKRNGLNSHNSLNSQP